MDERKEECTVEVSMPKMDNIVEGIASLSEENLHKYREIKE